MRLFAGILSALLITAATSAATLTPEQIQTVLKSGGMTKPGGPLIWHVEQAGDGKPLEPGGIAWWITVYYPPEAFADDICVIEGQLVQINDHLSPLNYKSRRKIALRACEGIEPSDFVPLTGVDDREMLAAIRVVQTFMRTGAVAGWSVEFTDHKARGLMSSLTAKRLYSIAGSLVGFRTDTCGLILWMDVSEAKHTVRISLDQLESRGIKDESGPPCPR